jgi:hypothetical protein
MILRRLNQGGLSFSVTPDLKNGSFIFQNQKIVRSRPEPSDDLLILLL